MTVEHLLSKCRLIPDFWSREISIHVNTGLYFLLQQCLLQVLGEPEGDYAGNQPDRQWFVEREMNRTFGALVCRKFLPEGFDAGGCRIEANVIFEGSKIDQHSILPEGGHAVADDFLGFGCSTFDGCTNFLQ